MKLEEVDVAMLRAWMNSGIMPPDEYRAEMEHRGLLSEPTYRPSYADLKKSLAAARVIKDAGKHSEAFDLLALVIDSLPDDQSRP